MADFWIITENTLKVDGYEKFDCYETWVFICIIWIFDVDESRSEHVF